MKRIVLAAAIVVLAVPSAFGQKGEATSPYAVVLGVAQDAGMPQAGCRKACCAAAWGDPARRRLVSCIAIVDPASHQRWMIDATPDFREQLRRLDEITGELAVENPPPNLDGILLTHAHIGHYTGLMFLGQESMGAKGAPVFATQRMGEFLKANGPWSQLVNYHNIELREIAPDRPLQLNERLTVTPLRVPHREEYSDVLGFRIYGPAASLLFIPDIDKWERWDRRIEDLLAEVDVALLDGTFYADGEIPSRNMADIPHPFIVESMERFKSLPAEQRSRVHFIHLNHTNPALDPESEASRQIRAAGFELAQEGQQVPL